MFNVQLLLVICCFLFASGEIQQHNFNPEIIKLQKINNKLAANGVYSCKMLPNGHKIEWILSQNTIQLNFTISSTTKVSSSKGWAAIGLNSIGNGMTGSSITMGYGSTLNEYKATALQLPDILTTQKITNKFVYASDFKFQFTRPLTDPDTTYFDITNTKINFLVAYNDKNTPTSPTSFIKHSNTETHQINFFLTSSCVTSTTSPAYSPVSSPKISPSLSCFGKQSTDADVCSGKGKCISTDTCNCIQGYSGNQCQTAPMGTQSCKDFGNGKKVYWILDSNSIQINASFSKKLGFSTARGWTSVGINSITETMKGASIVLGYSNKIFEYKSSGLQQPTLLQPQKMTNTMILETPTEYILMFKRPLNDTNDVNYFAIKNENQRILFAYNENDTPTSSTSFSKHTKAWYFTHNFYTYSEYKDIRVLKSNERGLEKFQFLSVFTLYDFFAQTCCQLHDLIPDNILDLELKQLNLYNSTSKNTLKFEIELQSMEGKNFRLENLNFLFLFKKNESGKLEYKELVHVISDLIAEDFQMKIFVDFFSWMKNFNMKIKNAQPSEEIEYFSIIKGKYANYSNFVEFVKNIEKKQNLELKKKMKIHNMEGEIYDNYLDIKSLYFDINYEGKIDLFDPIRILFTPSEIIVNFEKFTICNSERNRFKKYDLYCDNGSIFDDYFCKSNYNSSDFSKFPQNYILHPDTIFIYKTAMDNKLEPKSTKIISFKNQNPKLKISWEFVFSGRFELILNITSFSSDRTTYFKFVHDYYFSYFSDFLRINFVSSEDISLTDLKIHHLMDLFCIPFETVNFDQFQIIKVTMENEHVYISGFFIREMNKEVFELKIPIYENEQTELIFQEVIHQSLIVDLKREIKKQTQKSKILDLNFKFN
eukprot:gene9251-1338_t